MEGQEEGRREDGEVVGRRQKGRGSRGGAKTGGRKEKERSRKWGWGRRPRPEIMNPPTEPERNETRHRPG